MKIGVIDIGYNAIRAAAYEDDSLGAREIFNNKFKNDILSLLEGDELDVKHQTYLCLQYILDIFENLGVKRYQCVATAVLRNHERAEEFLEFVKERHGIEIEVISGDREAELTARGLLLGIPDASGVAADLGGGSLELAEVKDGAIHNSKSLDLGTKVLAQNDNECFDTLVDIIANEYSDEVFDNLYLIGGALRFISRFYIDLRKYPLKNLHNLSVSRYDFLDYLEEIDNPKFLKSKTGKRRINKNGILIARAMIEVFQPDNIIVSVQGLKEGVRYEMLDKKEQKKDVILEKLKLTYGGEFNKKVHESHFEVLSDLIGYDIDDYENIFRYVSIILSSRINYDQTIPPRALIESILCSEIQYKHDERVKLALIFSYLSNFKVDSEIMRISKSLLSKGENIICQIIGSYLRICQDVDGPELVPPSFNIAENDGYLEIDTKTMLPRSLFERVRDRLKSIAFCRRNLKQEIEGA